ncbi:unnamed protein product [Adineta ricciae]|uniref:SCP domain-containing protein n=1 Tax=Adineta ricciae TaxID=249248 RepID=A0A814F344_ADIRI|nr:unnamed protein product [Adineta ricciae]
MQYLLVLCCITHIYVRTYSGTFGYWGYQQPSYYRYDQRMLGRPRHAYQQPALPYGYMDMSYHPYYRHLYRDREASVHSSVTAELLQLHNQHRARHCAPPLTISERLNKIAQSYAEHLAKTSTFEHSGNKLGKEPLGENLYMQWISRGKVNASAKAADKSWYDEIEMHDFKHPTFSKETGHFTQLVWKDTKKMGVGVAFSPNGQEVYIVANYYPAGNIVGPGFFEKNVLPAKC